MANHHIEGDSLKEQKKAYAQRETVGGKHLA